MGLGYFSSSPFPRPFFIAGELCLVNSPLYLSFPSHQHKYGYQECY
jgi:hypothetical protein